ncbi:MAG: aryl-sulfate sulfotransferase [Planctomycetota bacterium]|jgi:hypothetical protein
MKSTSLLMFLVFAACDGSDLGSSRDEARVLTPATQVVHEAQPSISWTPVKGAERYRVRVYLDPAHTVLHETIATSDTATTLAVPLPDGAEAYALVEAVALADSTLWRGEVRFRHIALPEWMPDLTLVRRVPGHTAGYRLFNLFDLGEPDDPRGGQVPAIILVDDEGSVVWWYRHHTTGSLQDARVLPNGNLMTNYLSDRDAQGRFGEGYALEITWEGQVVWQSRPDVRVHHEAGPGPDGDYLYLKWTYREIDGRTIEGDGLEIADPETGAVLWQWDMFDHFVFEDWPTPETETVNWSGHGQDWSHSNAAVWDPGRSVIWMSSRHFDAVFAVAYPSGDVVTILGRNGLGGQGLFSHQHAPEVQADGSLLIWDNGNGAEPPRSRVVQLAFDEQAGTVEEVFEWRDTPDLFDTAVGDADRLPNGNILATAGVSGRMMEITPAGEIVWELKLSGDDTWWFYRSEFVPAEQVPDRLEPFAD